MLRAMLRSRCSSFLATASFFALTHFSNWSSYGSAVAQHYHTPHVMRYGDSATGRQHAVCSATLPHTPRMMRYGDGATGRQHVVAWDPTGHSLDSILTGSAISARLIPFTKGNILCYLPGAVTTNIMLGHCIFRSDQILKL